MLIVISLSDSAITCGAIKKAERRGRHDEHRASGMRRAPPLLRERSSFADFS